ncbi:MAG: hypothetical protein ABWY00_03485 [Dongiaceae bacterium]
MAAAPPPKTQFPDDPDRAAEAGFTYGEAAPEKPGRQMATPPATPTNAPLTSAERADIDRQQQATEDETQKVELEREFTQTAEKIGPRGDYKA